MADRPVTLITGATGGIGSALAGQAAAAGHDLILTARHPDALAVLAESLFSLHGIRVLVAEADLSLTDGADRLFNAITASGWRVDQLINNAGFGICGPLAEAEPGQLADLLQVNLLSLTTLTRLLLPSMISRGSGGILNVASLAAFQPGPAMAVYYASKAYVLSFSEALSMETHGTGVRISCLCPGAPSTGFASAAGIENSRLFRSGTMSPEAVAQSAWKGFSRGKRVIIPGFKNKLLAMAGRFAPHALSLPVVRFLHRKK